MKNWIEIGEYNRPELVTINLLEDEEAVNLTKKSEKTDWDYLFVNQKEYNDLLEEYNKKIDEVMLPFRYDEAVFSNYNPSEVEIETEIRGQKVWLDDESENRPKSIILYLFANEEVVGRQVVREEDEWRYRFTNIPLYNEIGDLINYHVEEREIEGYETSYKGSTIINCRKEVTEGKIHKKWRTAEKDYLPNDIQVSLFRNAEKLEEIKLSKETNWQHLLTDLEVYDEEGKAYIYSLVEEGKTSELGGKVTMMLGTSLDEKEPEARKIGLALVGGVLILLGFVSKLSKRN